MAGTAFRFRYRQVLELKEKQEQALSVKLASVDRDIARCRGALERWEGIMEETIGRLRERRRKGNLADCDYYADYLNHVRAQMSVVGDELTELRERRGGVREELERLMQERRTFEELREREKRAFLAGREKREQMAMDSHSLARFSRAEGAR